MASGQFLQVLPDLWPFGRGDAEARRGARRQIGRQPVRAQDALESRADPLHGLA